MKKVISLLVLVLLSLTIFLGCSSSNQKSKEELKAEIKAKMEVEQKEMQKSNQTQENSETRQNTTPKTEKNYSKSNDISFDKEEKALIKNIHGTYSFAEDMGYTMEINGSNVILYDNGLWMENSVYEITEVNTSESYIIVKIIDKAIEGEVPDENSAIINYLDKIIYEDGKLTLIHDIDAEDSPISEWVKGSLSTDGEHANQLVPEERKGFSKEMILNISTDLVRWGNLFEPGIKLPKTPEAAESFAYYLVFKTSEQHIIDNYIPIMDNLIPHSLTVIKDGKVDGRYIEALGEAIFGVDIMPEKEYTYSSFDLALCETELIGTTAKDGIYSLGLNILDDTSSPFLKMILKLTNTDEYYTRIVFYGTYELD